MGDQTLLPFPADSFAATEWLGGVYQLSQQVREGRRRVRPGIVMWVELPSGLILTARIFLPDEAAPLAETAATMLERLPEGASRPSRLRVPDADLAAEVRRELPRVPIVVAPVPELDAIFGQLDANFTASGAPSYLSGGVRPEAMQRLFEAAVVYWRAAPWRLLDHDEILRVDAPQLSIEGGCLSVIGGMGKSFGLAFFSSIEALDAFPELLESDSEIDSVKGEESATAFLSLNFVSQSDLPPEMIHEARERGWPVTGKKAWPALIAFGDDHHAKTLAPADLALLTACTVAVAALIEHHGREIARAEPLSETFREEDITLTLTIPYPGDEPERDASELGHDLVMAIADFAGERFGRGWTGRAGRDFKGDDASLQLFVPWIAWSATRQGKRVAELFLSAKRKTLTHAEIESIEAQGDAWLSVWEVTAVDPGEGMRVRDLLTGEKREVRERTASQTLMTRDTILGRIVKDRGVPVFDGLYGRSLPPLEAAEVLDRVRARLGVKRTVEPERLRDPMIGRFLIDEWQHAVEDFDDRHSRPPRLQNTDGDPLRFIEETFEFDPAMRSQIEHHLERIRGAQHDGDEITIVRKDDTVTGHIRIEKRKLRLETNSERRADALAQSVRRACGERLRHGRRKEQKPSKTASAEPPAPLPAELVQQMKANLYERWLDDPIPALGGKTPRAAVRTKKGREQLDVLLRDLENREARVAPGERFDVEKLRRKLGM